MGLPDHDAEPHLGHVRRMPRSVRKALGEALVAQADAQVIPVPTALFERAVVEAMADLAGLVARIDAYRQAGDTKTALALLREVHALRDRLGRTGGGCQGGDGGDAMNSLFATCSDPTTPGETGSAAVQRTIPTGPGRHPREPGTTRE